MLKIVRICCYLMVLVLYSVATKAPAQNQTLAGLKAAYVYNIAKFTRWPADMFSSDASHISLCLYGENDVTIELTSLNGHLINSHPIRGFVPTSEHDFKQCHILYISPTEKRRYGYILSLVDANRVLTISDDMRFIKSGGLINLVEIQQRLRFQINKQLLSEQELTLSSKLLKLAIMLDSSR